jgi:hypothetical protein
MVYVVAVLSMDSFERISFLYPSFVMSLLKKTKAEILEERGVLQNRERLLTKYAAGRMGGADDDFVDPNEVEVRNVDAHLVAWETRLKKNAIRVGGIDLSESFESDDFPPTVNDAIPAEYVSAVAQQLDSNSLIMQPMLQLAIPEDEEAVVHMLSPSLSNASSTVKRVSLTTPAHAPTIVTSTPPAVIPTPHARDTIKSNLAATLSLLSPPGSNKRFLFNTQRTNAASTSKFNFPTPNQARPAFSAATPVDKSRHANS